RSGAAFARVGRPGSPLTTAGHVSDLTVSDATAAGGSSATAQVSNGTGVPQYDLDVYAVATKGDRYVVAGRTSLEHLGVDQSSRPSVPLIGDAKGARVTVFAPQTLFQ